MDEENNKSDLPVIKTQPLNATQRMRVERLNRAGKLDRIARGVYVRPNAFSSEFSSFVLATSAVPRSVICLISALQYYELTTQLAWEVWLAIPANRRTPKIEIPVRLFWYPPELLEIGAVTIKIDGAPVRIFNPARTIADCFKYRNKIGLDVCIEALKEGKRKRLFTSDQLWKYAELTRVRNVMRPYLEAST